MSRNHCSLHAKHATSLSHFFPHGCVAMAYHAYRNSKMKTRVYCTDLSILKLQIYFWGQIPHHWENRVQMQKSRVPRSSVMKMSRLSNHAIPKFSPKNMAHLLTLTSDLGGLHECHIFLKCHTESRAHKRLSQEWECLDQGTSLHMHAFNSSGLK